MPIKEYIILYPKASIILISFLVTLVMTLVTKKFTNQSRMKELKDIQKACQIKLKQDGVKGNLEEMGKIQKQMMECSMELMKHSFRPMLITFIPIIVLFWWIKGVYTGILSSWIWWYLGAAIISSIILRKFLNVV